MAYIAAMSSVWVLSLFPLVAMYSLVMFLILALSLFINRFDSSSYSAEEESVWATNLLSRKLRHVSFLSAAAYEAWFVAPLIACVLRFDFTATLSKQNPIYLEGVTPSSSFDSTTNQRLGNGVLVPRTVPRTFRKPYYTVALATWSLIRITTIVLCLTTSFPLKSIYDSSWLGAIFEFPIITIVLLLFAKMRGQAKTLWNYTEIWFVKPSNVKGELLPVGDDKTGPQPEHATA
ncbi:hypothetical protein Clacol_008074 [Clathrus columnatus]|uniref:Uncharacterized protein n=1 Tax=Clathrus columnatus TaxID=1419009 RepID=A0AAV5AGP8_9AGAM|nr:hypothetical protein Clacol_008074 [Clathrus columnatus]